MKQNEMRDQVAAAMEKIIKILQEEDTRTPGVSLEIMANLLGLVLVTNNIGPDRVKRLYETVEKAAEMVRAYQQGKVH